MARTQDQARWEKKARASGRKRVALWLSDEAVSRLDSLVSRKRARGRAQALEQLLKGLPDAGAPRYRLKRPPVASGRRGWDVLIGDERVGNAKVRGDGTAGRWVATAARGLAAYEYKGATREAAVAALLRGEELA